MVGIYTLIITKTLINTPFLGVFLCFIVTVKATSRGVENTLKRYPLSNAQKHPLKKLGMQLGTQLGTHLRIFWHTSLRGKIHDFGHFERKCYRVGSILHLVVYCKSLIYNILTKITAKKCLFSPIYYVLSGNNCVSSCFILSCNSDTFTSSSAIF